MNRDMDVEGAPIAPFYQADRLAEPAINRAAVAPAESDSTRSKILQHIIRHTAPALLPAPWSFLSPTNSVRSLSCTPPELVASLQNNFSAAELTTARVLIERPDEPIQLVPVLAGPRLEVLISKADREQIGLVSDAGSLYGDDPPCFQFACQRLSSAGQPQHVFVAPLEDLQIFRCLGVRCTPAAGLAHIDGQQVHRLYADLSPTSPPRYRLTLVGASLARLEPEMPAHIKPVLKRMWQIEDLFGHGSDDELFDVWWPNIVDLHRIRAAATFSDRKIVRAAIADSLDVSVCSCSHAWQRFHEPAEGDLARAHACVIEAMSNAHPASSDLHDAVTRLSAMLERATTRRYLQAAAAAPHPLISPALILMAEISQNVNQNYGPLANARRQNPFASRRIDQQPLPEARLDDIDRTIKQLSKLRPMLFPIN